MTLVPISAQLASRAEAIVESVQQTTYQHTTAINAERGLYDCDCSGFVSYILSTLAPRHYASIPREPDQDWPRAFMYYDYLSQLGGTSTAWRRISSLYEAQPGDVIAWRFPEVQAGHDTGHVMFVAALSASMAPGGNVSVAVYDSADVPHFDDTRGGGPGQFLSGVGLGTIQFQVQPDGSPTAFLFAPGDHMVTLPIVIGRAGPIPS